MSRTKNLVLAALLGQSASVANAFVLLSNRKVTLPVSSAAPTIQFIWDGKAPAISDKADYKGGQFQELSDTAFMQRLLQDSMDVWNAVPGSYIEMQVAIGTAELSETDRQYSIVVESNDNLSTAAFAKPFFEEDSDVIKDCDISISDRETPADEMAFTITHELGHCLGLGHNHTNYGAIMGYSRTSRSLSLGLDDIAGLIFLYPDPTYDDGEVKELVACGVLGLGQQPFAGFALFLLPLLIAICRRLC